MNDEERTAKAREGALLIASWCSIEKEKYKDHHYKYTDLFERQKQMLEFVEELDKIRGSEQSASEET